MTILQSQRQAGIAVDQEKYEKDAFYPSPPEAVEALLRQELFYGDIWECACGDGAISKVLEAHKYKVISTDLVDRGYGQSRIDFLMERKKLAPNIITNPPYSLATEFLEHAINLSTGKVAMLLRLGCLAGQERGKLYEKHTPARIYVFSNRLQMFRNGEIVSGSGMFDFMWIVFYHKYRGNTKLRWINTNGE